MSYFAKQTERSGFEFSEARECHLPYLESQAISLAMTHNERTKCGIWPSTGFLDSQPKKIYADKSPSTKEGQNGLFKVAFLLRKLGGGTEKGHDPLSWFPHSLPSLMAIGSRMDHSRPTFKDIEPQSWLAIKWTRKEGGTGEMAFADIYPLFPAPLSLPGT